MSSSDGERVWIERAKGGDLEAFEKLYRSYVRQVYGLCRRLLESEQDAEDMTQGVFLRAWRRIDRFQGHSRLGTWLRRIAVNLVIDERKSSWQKLLDTQVSDEVDLVSPRLTLPDAAVDLERALELLPPGSRQVLVLHDMEGYTHTEMASLLGVTTGTTKTQLFRARRALREFLR